MPKSTKGQDVFGVLNSYLEYCGLNWRNCVGICTDGAPAMTGHLKGFVSIAQKQDLNIIPAHCFIYREALVAKTLGPELKFALDMGSKNMFIISRLGHLNVDSLRNFVKKWKPTIPP